MLPVELALSKSIVDLLVERDIYEHPDVARDLADIIRDCDDEEANAFPGAMAAALRLVRSDLPRWRSGLDAAVVMDVHECVAELVTGISGHADIHQLGSLATLASSPSVDQVMRTRVATLIEAHQTPSSVGRLLAIRLGGKATDNRLESALERQLWPGRFSPSELRGLSPIVYVSDVGTTPGQYWQVISSLVQAGARVRRVQRSATGLWSRDWASDAYPIVTWSGDALKHWRALTHIEKVRNVLAPRSSAPLEVARFLRQIDAAMPTGIRLPGIPDSNEGATAVPAFTPDTLRSGAFDAAEMIFLGAASRSTLQRLAKQGLAPYEADVHRWSFEKLVALRLVQGFKSTGRRLRVPTAQLLDRMTDIAEASQTHRVAVDVDGHVYVDSGDGFVTTDSKQGQTPIQQVLDVDKAFRPFELGGGAVPDLLRPGQRTIVHPLVLGGTPVLRERRVSARSIALMATRGQDVIRSAFPELTAYEISDATKVGSSILAAKES